MRFWNTIILLVFLNFTALPSIAVIFDWEDVSITNNIYEEEEEEQKTADIVEKLVPERFNVEDFVTTLEQNTTEIFIDKEKVHISPYLSLYSPPPEVV